MMICPSRKWGATACATSACAEEGTTTIRTSACCTASRMSEVTPRQAAKTARSAVVAFQIDAAARLNGCDMFGRAVVQHHGKTHQGQMCRHRTSAVAGADDRVASCLCHCSLSFQEMCQASLVPARAVPVESTARHAPAAVHARIIAPRRKAIAAQLRRVQDADVAPRVPACRDR